jgi:outer membrane protein assembly factor BamB
MRHVSLAVTVLSLVLFTGSTHAADWLQFRGPGGLATGTDKNLPTEWSSTKNIDWKTELPGGGTSSPIILGKRLYITCYSGYGLDRDNPGDQTTLMRHVVCVDRASGKIVWQKPFTPAPGAESKYQGNGAHHGYSTSTPTTDGERLYVFFGKSGVYCLNLDDGSEIWQASVGTKTTGWGSSNSPILFKDLLIINASIESSSIVALDSKTGKEVWNIGGIRGARNTPTLVDVPDGQPELVVCVAKKILAFDPTNGKELWSCEGIPDKSYVCPSVIAHEGIVYAIGGRQNTAIAVKAGGRGDVTETHKLWETAKGSNVSSPVYHDGHIYWLHDSRGVVYCLNATTGEVVYEERLSPRPGRHYSSVMVADGKIYAASQHGGAFVIAAQPEFKLIAHNVFKDDEARTNAGPVPHNGQLLLRSDKFLYCIGKKAE